MVLSLFQTQTVLSMTGCLSWITNIVTKRLKCVKMFLLTPAQYNTNIQLRTKFHQLSPSFPLPHHHLSLLGLDLVLEQYYRMRSSISLSWGNRMKIILFSMAQRETSILRVTVLLSQNLVNATYTYSTPALISPSIKLTQFCYNKCEGKMRAEVLHNML